MFFKCCHSNFPQTLSGCHGNKIWDKMGYNLASVRDICKIFVSIRGFSGSGHRMLPIKFYTHRHRLPWQRICKIWTQTV